MALPDTETRCCPGAPPPALRVHGSRRRRLWEMAPHVHCPVIGVCLPLPALRRLANKTLGGQALAGDYELHCGAVTDCQHRSPLAEAVQRELDRRFSVPLRRAAAAKTSDELAAWWAAQRDGDDLPGALWSTLSHPRCTPALEQRVLGQVHMLQHQVGMATRAELARFEALIDENAVLARELADAQRRCTQQAAVHAEQSEALRAQAIRLRGELLARDGALARLTAQAQAIARPGGRHNDAADEADPGRADGDRRQAQQAERVAELRRLLQAARADAERWRAQAAQRAAAAPSAANAEPGGDAAAALALANRAVLCVGGRTASVPVYRRLVEGHGGRFLHHDGGEENSSHLLDTTLAAADLVICQAGCVSHGAYWRVKDHCKRTGKRCVFVETPSTSALQRALAELQDSRNPEPPSR